MEQLHGAEQQLRSCSDAAPSAQQSMSKTLFQGFGTTLAQASIAFLFMKAGVQCSMHSTA